MLKISYAGSQILDVHVSLEKLIKYKILKIFPRDFDEIRSMGAKHLYVYQAFQETVAGDLKIPF